MKHIMQDASHIILFNEFYDMYSKYGFTKADGQNSEMTFAQSKPNQGVLNRREWY